MRINVFKSGGNSAQGGFVSNGLNLQGPLILSGPHTEPLHAVPKQYVDNAAYNLHAENITSGVLAPARLPAFTGDVTTILGTSNINLANTGVTPGSIIKPTVDAKGRVLAGGTLTEEDISAISFDKVSTNRPTTLAGYGITNAISISNNNTIQGDLLLVSDPTNDEHAVTKQYVDSIAGIAGGISVGDIIRKPYTTTPAGFLKCNGAEVDKSIYANLYSVIGDTFNNDLTIGSGRPWQQQYRFNDSQTSDVLGWVSDTALPSVFAHTTVIATKNRVYAFGGYLGSGSYSATVYTAPINEDGTLGAWVAGTSLPAGLIASSAIVTNNRVYLIGGATGTGTHLSTVRTAVINSDGTLGAWTTGPSLPGNLAWTKSIITKNRVYTFGGYNGSAAISTIYTTTINSDGTLNSWSVHGTLPAALYVPYVAIIKDRVYIIGGWNGAYLSSVYYAPIDNNGVIGTISSGVFLPKGMSHGECFTTKNKLHINFGSEVWTSNINSDGSLGNWYKSASLPVEMADTECVITSSKIYLISSTTLAGGYTNNVVSANFSGGLNDYSAYYGDTTLNYLMPGSGRPWQQQYQINETQSAQLTGWSATTSLPGNLYGSQAIVTKNRVYMLGGHNGTTYVSTVYTAPINSDGTLGTWTTGTALPIAIAHSQAIITKNRVYLIGGYNTNGVTSSVYTAPINTDGTLGSWVAVASDVNIALTGSGTKIIPAGVTSIRIIGSGSNGDDGWTNFITPVGYTNGVPDSNVTTNFSYVWAGYMGGPVLNSYVVATTPTGSAQINMTSQTSSYVEYAGVIGGVSYSIRYTVRVDSAPTNGVSSNISVNGTNYVFAGGVQAPATQQTHNITLPGTSSLNLTYNIASGAGGYGNLSYIIGNPLPVAKGWGKAIVTKNRVYYIGGSNGTVASSTVFSSLIGSDGTIGVWTTEASLPISVHSPCLVSIKNRLYILGGVNGSGTFTANYYTATINSDGLISTWSNLGTLPVIFGYSDCFITKNRVYIISGRNGGTNITSIWSAPINSDSTLGTFTIHTNTLPFSGYHLSVFATNGRLFSIGGILNPGGASSAIYMASILEGLNDYSPYYDGTILPISTESTTFKLPDYTLLDKEFGEYVTSYIKF